MLAITKMQIFKIKSTVTVKNILDETFFMLDCDTGNQYNLTEMEYEIVNAIIIGKTFGDIVDEIAAHYDADRFQIESDLREYFTALLEANLIVSEEEECCDVS